VSARDPLAGLPPALAVLVDGLCDDFERHWQRARRRDEPTPDPAAFVLRAPEAARDALRLALAKLQRELHAGAGWPEVPGYRLLGEIARGPMGIVYRVRRETDGRELALKALQSAALALWSRSLRLAAEGEVLTELRHPHIVPVECFGQHAGLPYLVMPLVEGGDLRQRLPEFSLRAGEPGRLPRIAVLMAKVAGAVAWLHSRGVLHRDLKPSNILLTRPGPDCEPLVCDFGLALRVRGPQADAPAPQLVGTLPYMAPEQREGREATIASDIWGLGAVLHELLTGQPPLPDGPAALDSDGAEAMCRRCLARDPADRYLSAKELEADLWRLSSRPDAVTEDNP